jgi:hypothetical protein
VSEFVPSAFVVSSKYVYNSLQDVTAKSSGSGCECKVSGTSYLRRVNNEFHSVFVSSKSDIVQTHLNCKEEQILGSMSVL